MKADWTSLRAELALWRAAQLDLPIWWRDDDAVQDTANLHELQALAAEMQMPAHLAVIPKHATHSLVERCACDPLLIPLVHGWAHDNHAPDGEKKAEFNHPRPGARAELAQGLSRLEGLFAERLVKVFVPPWNRISADMIEGLPALGYGALSTFTPRQRRLAAPGLVQINTHLDPINWRAGGRLHDTEALISNLTALLRARRLGTADRAEPLGLLTHHLVHDPAIWEFTRACFGELLAGGAEVCDLRAVQADFP